MYSNSAAAILQPEKIYGTFSPDAAAVANPYSALCLDLTKVTGGTTTKGQTITQPQSAGVFCAIPAAGSLNQWAFLGISDQKALAKGDWSRILMGGPTYARVRNTSGGTQVLPVGRLLYLVPGQDYLTFGFQANGHAGGVGQVDYAGHAVAMVRESTSIANSTTDPDVPVWLFPWGAGPRSDTIRKFYDVAPADLTAYPLAVTRGPGKIGRVVVGCLTGGSTGWIAIDVLIAATSIYSVTPKINNDCIDTGGGYNSGISTATPAAGAGPGSHTAGDTASYGVYTDANLFFLDRQLITLTLAETSTWNGTGFFVEVDLLYA